MAGNSLASNFQRIVRGRPSATIPQLDFRPDWTRRWSPAFGGWRGKMERPYLTRLTGANSNTIAFSAAGQALVGGSSLVGHCVNFLPLRLSANLDQGFAPHLHGISSAVLDALENQTLDFVSFVQEIQPNRDGNWAPLVTVGVNLAPSTKSIAFADLDVEAGSVGRVYEQLDLFLNFVESGEDLELQCTFNRALFDAQTMQRRMHE